MDLYTASALGIRELVKNCIKRNPAAVLKPNEKGWTPLMYACVYCQEEIVALLVDTVPSSAYSINGRGQTPLMLSTETGNLNLVKILTKPEILECKDEKGWTALFYAVHFGHTEIVYYLLKWGANANTRDYKSWTILMIAVQGGREDIVALLLTFGVDCKLTSGPHDLTAIDLAHKLKNLKLIILLSVSTVTDLSNLLKHLRLDKYSALFEENDIDLKKFFQLDECDLKLLGISKIGPRKIMTLAITKYNHLIDFKKRLENDLYF